MQRVSTGISNAAWNAILKRDRCHDGRFVYAALTTGIYCRPSCPARHPNRRNTLIFTTSAEAEREGFTACLRCHPKSHSPCPAELGIRRVLEWIETHIQQPVTLGALSQVSGFSPNHLQQLFKRTIGLSPKEFCDARRLEYFKRFIKQDVSVSVASYQAGFGSSRALYEKASKKMGMTPGVYGQGGRGLRIRYRLFRFKLGCLLIGATQQGVCAVLTGDNGVALVRWLRREFPKATIERAHKASANWDAMVRRCEMEDHFLSKMPFDLRRRVFEAKAWKALR